MERIKDLRIICLIIMFKLGVITPCFAQNTSLEFWPETDMWYRLSHSWRLSAFIPITKYNESKYRDINVYLQADYSWGRTKHFMFMRLVDGNRRQQVKGWLARGGIMKGWSLGENYGSYTEEMLFAEMHRRITLKGNVLFSNRLRTDFRWVGQEPKFSYRIRYRLMLEKEFKSGRGSNIPYINAEPYWDSRYNNINRVRFAAGTTLTWGSRFAYEGNITYQYDEQYSSPNMFALNLILHVFFETKKSASK